MRALHISALLAAFAMTAWLVTSCVGSPAARRVELETRVVGLGGEGAFENVPPTGVDPWTVVLDEAWAALGPIYLFEGEPLLVQALERLVMPRAFAHPGHYQEGEALGEALDQRVFDLLDPDGAALGTMQAVTGTCHSARVGLGTAEAGLADGERLAGHALLLRGVASRGDERIPFEGWLDVDLYVEGIEVELDVDEAPGHLLVEVDLERWLRRVDFATASPGEGDEPAAVVEGTQAHNALTRGVDNTLAYRLRWVGGEE